MPAKFVMALTCAALAIPATVAAAPRDRVPAATAAGTPEDCLQLSQIRESRVRSDTVIDFVTRGNKVYRNTLPNSCPSLGFEEAFSYSTSINQLCSVDIITVLRRAGGPGPIRGASCGLGKFQPVTLADKRKR